MKKIFLAFGIATTIFIGCKNVENKENVSDETMETTDNNVVDSHNSENSLDWAGVYEGTTPCADCEGIKTVLELRDDKTYTLSQTYLGKMEGENEFVQTGNFVWDESGSKVLLKSESDTLQYKVGENQLWMLDSSGNMVEGDLAEFYILKKTLQ
ncbi:copper resistance protein NlpE [Aequorivita vladivostokensis]|uniref:Lipoprotein n=1 Tax=Aequorivita vladivostokensis TaxID=171194 RepID=A0ABR5DFV0_9FLAO|nr:copper resistance protein NlpE [Aequorivita vladivostokensis]KJJ37631.1 hypothetical protein MB09_12760 [Aequorivita vladivostokensis]|tara:strand:+ start:444 stop:905 length:462 start_codon:yes stop_codon:yes gene_type:complete